MTFYTFDDCPDNSQLKKPRGNFFVMLFPGRTGSTFIINVLNQHPEILFEGEWLELFNGKPDSTEQQTRWIEQLWSSDHRDRYQAIGFKTKFKDIPNTVEFKKTLDKFRPTILLSERRNPIKQAISLLRSYERAEQKRSELLENEWEKNRTREDIWNVYDSSEKLEKTYIDLQKLHENVLIYEDYSKILKKFTSEVQQQFKLDVVSYYYEDLLKNEKLFFEKIFKMLGVELIPFQHQVFKHTPDNISSIVRNYGELKRFYSGTKYESFL